MPSALDLLLSQLRRDLEVEAFRELYFGGGMFWHELYTGDAA